MIFAQPDSLWSLALVPAWLLLAAWAAKRRSATLAVWGQRDAGQQNEHRRWVRDILLAVALACMALALAQPKGAAETRLLQQRGIDVVLALDLSKSMLARDVQPDRLRRAVFEAERLLDRLAGHRIALVVFAGTAFVQAPLTTDFAVVRNLLRGLDPLQMPYPGTNLAAALERSIELLRAASGSRAIVLLTDGEQTAGNALEVARHAAAAAIPIFVLAVGTPHGEPILVPSASGEEVLRDPSGRPVLSKLDEDGLQQIAKLSHGRYYRLGLGGGAVAVGGVLDRLEKKLLEERTVSERKELYSYFAGPALLVLLVAWWLSRTYAL